MCNYFNNLNLLTPSNSTIDPIINAIKIGCDPNYFKYKQNLHQSDVTGNLFQIPHQNSKEIDTNDIIDSFNNKESFGNVILNKKNKNNNIHFSSFFNR